LAVHNCLFNIFVVTLHIWRPYPPTTTRMHHDMVTGTHIICMCATNHINI